MPFTVEQLVEWVTKHPKGTIPLITRAKRLREMDGVGGDMPMGDEPAADADPNDAITAGFKAAFDAIRDQLFSGKIDPKAGLKKLKSLLDGHGDATADGKTAPTDDAGGADDGAAEEARKRPKGLAGYIAEAKTFGLKEPTTAQLAVLEAIPSQAGRKAYCDEAAARLTEAETPRSGGKKPGAGPHPDQSKPAATGPKPLAESAPPTGGADYAKRVSE